MAYFWELSPNLLIQTEGSHKKNYGQTDSNL